MLFLFLLFFFCKVICEVIWTGCFDRLRVGARYHVWLGSRSNTVCMFNSRVSRQNIPQTKQLYQNSHSLVIIILYLYNGMSVGHWLWLWWNDLDSRKCSNLSFKFLAKIWISKNFSNINLTNDAQVNIASVIDIAIVIYQIHTIFDGHEEIWVTRCPPVKCNGKVWFLAIFHQEWFPHKRKLIRLDHVAWNPHSNLAVIIKTGRTDSWISCIKY